MSIATDLDALYLHQRKRIAEINEKGINFQIIGGKIDTFHKGIVRDSATIHLHPSTPLLPGTIIKSESGIEYIVRSATLKAGRVEADVVTVNAHVDILKPGEPMFNAVTKQSKVNYWPSAVNVPCRRKGDEIAVSSSQAPRPGFIVKMNSSFYEVQNVLNCGAISYVWIAPVPEPGSRKTAPPTRYGSNIEFVTTTEIRQVK
jgi:hypothetical protein